MKPVPPGGVPLLDAEESAGVLGVTTGRFEGIRDLGFIKPLDTPVGPRYRRDELEDLAEAIAPAVARPQWIRPSEAARMLGVTVPTLRIRASEGLLHRNVQGHYDAAEIRALNKQRAGRKALRPPQPARRGT